MPAVSISRRVDFSRLSALLVICVCLAAEGTSFAQSSERGRAQAEALDIRRQVHSQLANLGCRATAADIATMARELTQRLEPVAARGMFGIGNPEFELNRTRRAACDIEKTGRVPAFEQFLTAVTDGRRADPCTYDPAREYPELNDILYLDQDSAASFNLGSFNTDNFSRALDNTRRGECFRNILRAALTGRLASRPWVERSTVEPAAPVTAPDEGAAARARMLADRAARCASVVGNGSGPKQPGIAVPPAARVVGVVTSVNVDGCTVTIKTPQGVDLTFWLDGKALIGNITGEARPQRTVDLGELVGTTLQVSWFGAADGRPRATLIGMLKQ